LALFDMLLIYDWPFLNYLLTYRLAMPQPSIANDLYIPAHCVY